ncbi:MAG TPA: sensor histidine kinase KdpD [Patescibacteria group bacterium]|nr:sensor histidine kinase KdpD [Patescibacteria group bacterium]
MAGDNKEVQRPDPDELLEKISRANRGKLTVFLGAAAGVGKTYTMLETAQERLADGIQVVIGWIETHGRQETEKLVTGLPRLPARLLNYREREMTEMDVDAVLRLKPELVLVDELAHTNIPGSRHVRRFQDVEELLQAGINVYTTVNIQHIESLNDIVAQITGVSVRETVPDSVLEQADTIQLIDIPPEELIKRLKEGKVYIPGQAERALQNFFRPGNINALRELALRFTARQVDEELSDYMREHRIDGPWPAAGRVMVCVSASPFSTQLIRAARRLADGLQADWLAVYVESSRKMTEAERNRVVRNLRLAEELGAKTLTVVGPDLVSEMLEAARSHNVNAVVVGKPRHSRWRDWLKGSVVDDLIRRSGGINVYVIQAGAEQEAAVPAKTEAVRMQLNWRSFWGGAGMSALVTAFCWFLSERLETVNIALLYQLPVIFSAFWWGRWPAYATALLCVLSFDYLFVPPFFEFTVADIRYIWSFGIFMLVAFVLGGRTEALRQEATVARSREKSTRALYEFSREIAAVIDMDTIARELARRAADTLERPVALLLPESDGRLGSRAYYLPGANDGAPIIADNPLVADAGEMAVAVWVYEHGQAAGRSTETLPGSSNLYLPLRTREKAVGVLGIGLGGKLVTSEERRLIDAWAGLAAMAMERVSLAEKAREAALLAESDRLRTALFNSISHELRTPLASIIGSVSTLLEGETVYTLKERQELLEAVQEGAARMERVVSNLLDTARLESGMLQLKHDWCDMEDIVGSALRRMGDHLRGRRINTQMTADLPLFRGDCVLLEQVLINLLDNALKYSPQTATVDIAVKFTGDAIQTTVTDTGAGIPEADLTQVFDKFYRVRQPQKSVSGTGLGLSICKGIVEAHGGYIWAENRTEGGVMLSFTIPVGTNEKPRPLPEKGEGYDDG